MAKRAGTALGMPGNLVTVAPIRLVDISRSGCLLESPRYVAAGTTGELNVELGGRPFSEQVRVTRCVPVEGAASRYRVGVEFLRTRRFDDTSLRQAAYAIRDSAGGVFVNGARLVPVD